MALSSFVVRRSAASLISFAARSAASSSLAHPSHGSSSFSFLHLFTPRRLPFSTSTCPPDSSDFVKFPACGASDKLSPVPQLNGLPFDSMEVDREGRTMALRRKTKDEIIEILVKEDYYDSDEIDKRICICMYVKIHYGLDFKKCMKFDIKALPDDPGQIVIPNMDISMVGVKGDGKAHVDEFVGFLERRGFNRSNLDFMLKYVAKRRANLQF